MKATTKIRKTLAGHQAGFTIGVQTFYLQEQLSEKGYTSFQQAKWYKEQLRTAFKNLTQQNKQ